MCSRMQAVIVFLYQVVHRHGPLSKPIRDAVQQILQIGVRMLNHHSPRPPPPPASSLSSSSSSMRRLPLPPACRTTRTAHQRPCLPRSHTTTTCPPRRLEPSHGSSPERVPSSLVIAPSAGGDSRYAGNSKGTATTSWRSSDCGRSWMREGGCLTGGKSCRMRSSS